MDAHPSTERLRRLRQNVNQFFNEEELRTLAFDLGLEYDGLPGRGKSDKVRELLAFLERNGRIRDLINLTKAQRPQVAWEESYVIDQAELPYKGLHAFDEEDAYLFVGRERLTAQLIGRLHRQHFLAIIGASGSGKSSLIRAGLIPAIHAGQPLFDGSLPPAGSQDWATIIITPTAQPLERLALSLTGDLVTVGQTVQVQKDLYADPGSLHLYARKLLDRQRKKHLLLIVDQLEELFTLCKNQAFRLAFIDNLINASIRQKDPALTLIISLRADFYSYCAQYGSLREAIARWQAYIGPMDRKELRRVIEEPARRTGWQFEPHLVDRMLDDVSDEPGALPLLSHALLETWNRRQGRVMTLQGYEASGGVKGAIARTAESTYRRLTPDDQDIARSIFIRLTELGEGTQDTRRRAYLDELIPSSDKKTRVESVLKTLTDARLVVTAQVTGPKKKMAIVDVAHEALIREWPTLRSWLSENREALRVHRQLTENVQEWIALGKDKSVLYRGARLAIVNDWLKGYIGQLNAVEREFLAASQAEEEREERQREDQRQKELVAARRLAREAEARSKAEAEQAREAQARAREQGEAAVRLRNRNRIITAIGSVALLAAICAFAGLVVATVFGLNSVQKSNENATLAVQAFNDKSTAEAANNLAARGQATAEAASTVAVAERAQAETQARLARESLSSQLVAQAESSLALSPGLSLLLAVEALDISFDAGDPALPENEALLRRVLANPLETPLLGHKGNVNDAAFSPDGRWLATIDAINAEPQTQPGEIRLWDLSQPNPGLDPILLGSHEAGIYTVLFSADGTQLVTGGFDGARIWDMTDLQKPPLRLGTVDLATIDLQDIVMFAEFSPDGRWLLTGNQLAFFGGSAILWDLQAADITQAKYALDVPGGILSTYVDNFAFSADGHWLAISNYPRETLLFDLTATGEVTKTLAIQGSSIFAPAFSPNGELLVTGDSDGALYITDLTVTDFMSETVSVEAHDGAIHSLAFMPGSRKLLTGGSDSLIKIWDLSDPQSPQQVDTLRGHRSSIIYLNTTADLRWLVSGASDFLDGAGSGNSVESGLSDVLIWDLTSPESPLVPRSLMQDDVPWGHEDALVNLAIANDGRWLATGSKDKSARVWDLTRPDPLVSPLILAGHQEAVAGVAFSPESTLLVTAGGLASFRSSTAHLWNLAAANLGEFPEPNTSHLGRLSALTGTDGFVLGGDSGGNIYMWDKNTLGRPPLAWASHQVEVASLAINSGGQLLASADIEGTVLLWEVTGDDATPKELDNVGVSVTILSFDPAGSRLFAAGEDGNLFIWQVSEQDGQPSVLAIHDGPVSSLVFDPAGQWLYTAGHDGIVRKHSLDELGNSNEVFAAESAITAMVMVPGRDMLVTGHQSGEIIGRNLAEPGQPSFRLPGHTGPVTSMAVLAAGHQLATAGQDGVIQIWDLVDPTASPSTIGGQQGQVNDLLELEDGRSMLAVNRGALRRWDLDVVVLRDLACRTVNRNMTPEEWETYFPSLPYKETCIPAGSDQ